MLFSLSCRDEIIPEKTHLIICVRSKEPLFLSYSKTEGNVRRCSKTRTVGEVEARALFLVVQWKLGQWGFGWNIDRENFVALGFGRNQPAVSDIFIQEDKTSVAGLSYSSRGISLYVEPLFCLVLL